MLQWAEQFEKVIFLESNKDTQAEQEKYGEIEAILAVPLEAVRADVYAAVPASAARADADTEVPVATVQAAMRSSSALVAQTAKHNGLVASMPRVIPPSSCSTWCSYFSSAALRSWR